MIGPQLANNLLNLGLMIATEGSEEYGYSLDEVLEQAEEPGLGNGGLGKIEWSLKVPATGRYKFGIFKHT